MAKLSPMMQQYLETKEQYKDCILLYRLGDFYEMFFEDAITASKELQITLTGKDCGLEERAPMCGVPYHALEGYLNKLVSKGYKVAIGEQVEDPKFAKGLVKREVVRVVTPGTNISSSGLDETKNNYLMSIAYIDNCFGIAVSDVTTGDFYLTEVDSVRELMDEIYKFSPTEILSNDALFVSGVNTQELEERLNIKIYPLESWFFDDAECKKKLLRHFKLASLSGLGLEDFPCGILSAGSLLMYLYETQKTNLSHLTTIKPYSTGKYMVMDTFTRRNLELTETLREKSKKGSLLGVLDKTKTAMGARLLRSFIEQPLISKEEIVGRQESIEEFNKNLMSRDEIREYLNPIYDLERLVTKISYYSANPRDLIAFKNSLEMIPHIKNILKDFSSTYIRSIYEKMDDLQDLTVVIDKSIQDDPPIAVKDGGIIKEGYSEEVDRLRKAKTEGKNWLAEFEVREREKTGIKNLRIKFNKVFGYCIEITNSYKEMAPDYYIRKQTLSNAERYTTPELKELEDIILGAEDKLFSLEYILFDEIRKIISDEVLRIQNTAKMIATIDVLSCLAFVAERNNYIKPEINESGVVNISKGRHPVVELMLANNMFVANDTYLDNQDRRVSIITGPNMAGKSTYMRQTALIVLMAQIGSFVPSEKASIGICDRIFTRVGASDDLSTGQSTFMVEMTEVANIIRNATSNSLLILDEIGRGTSTFDGLSIAWAVTEYISNPKLLGAKTLFATHYHELTELEGILKGVNNYCIAVKEQGDDIVFLRKIVKGGADKSYGIQVAKLAGVPDIIINRAKEILVELAETDIVLKPNMTPKKIEKTIENSQITMFDVMKNEDIISEINDMDLGTITPIDALNVLYKIQNKIKNRW